MATPGLTTAKVAARSGENKALISYHFGSKDGLVKAVGREVGQSITAEVVEELGDPREVEQLVRGVLDGLWRVMDRDERIARLYFDLAAVSVVEPEVRAAMQEIKAGFREVLIELLAATDDGPGRRRGEAAAVFLIAGVEGFALERLDRGETPALRRAREMFVSSAAAALSRRRWGRIKLKAGLLDGRRVARLVLGGQLDHVAAVVEALPPQLDRALAGLDRLPHGAQRALRLARPGELQRDPRRLVELEADRHLAAPDRRARAD